MSTTNGKLLGFDIFHKVEMFGIWRWETIQNSNKGGVVEFRMSGVNAVFSLGT